MASQTLSARQLGRATLARQLLLSREPVPVAETVERLAGMQAQEPKPPFAGLWTRVEGFERAQLAQALRERSVVRATLMRATLHLFSGADYVRLRTSLQPALSAAMSALRGRDQGLDLERLVPVARELVGEQPRTFTELRALLVERFPNVDERALGYAVRLHLPLVMLPTDDPWAFPSAARFTLAEDWLGEPLSTADGLERLVLRYLGAFGPATPTDMQTWSGLGGLKGAFEALGDRLVRFQDERKRTLFDLPDAPRPDAAEPAPQRLLPAFDSLVLAHKDRTRVLADEHRGALVTKNLRVRPTFLVDGEVRGTWDLERKGARATLTLTPFGSLPRGSAGPLRDEAAGMARFLEPDASGFDVRVERGR